MPNRNKVGLPLILTVFLGLQLLVIQTPPRMVFDEVYYAPLANKVAEGVWTPLLLTHTPLGIETIAAGIWFFGDNPVGWRIMPVIFGCLTLLAMYMFTRKVYPQNGVPIAATVILGFTGVFFSFTGLGVLDYGYLMFGLLGFWLWAEKRISLGGMALGISFAYKLNFLILAAPLMLLWKREWRRLILLVFAMAFGFLAALLVGEAVYAQFNLAQMVSPGNRVATIFLTQVNWVETSPGSLPQCPPWLWMFLSISYKFKTGTLLGNFQLMGLDTLVLPLFLLTVPLAFKHRQIFPALWFLTAFLPWCVLTVLVPRPIYQFYVLNALPAIVLCNCLMLAQYRKALWVYVALVVGYFIICQYPFLEVIK